jgi:hypothetical protein
LIALAVGLGLAVDAAVSLAHVAAGVYEPLLAISLMGAIAVIGALTEARHLLRLEDVDGGPSHRRRRRRPASAPNSNMM